MNTPRPNSAYLVWKAQQNETQAESSPVESTATTTKENPYFLDAAAIVLAMSDEEIVKHFTADQLIEKAAVFFAALKDEAHLALEGAKIGV